MVAAAFQAIEDAASEIKIPVYVFGEVEYLEPVEVVWEAARYHGELWDVLTNQFESGEISVDLYRDSAIELIKEFRKVYFNHRIEKQLLKMMGEL